MAQRLDLYSLLTSYANKHNSPYIDIGVFFPFLDRYAKKMAEEQPEWNKWAQDAAPKFYAELAVLAEDGKCELIPNESDGRIYMPHFYIDILRQHYLKMDENADLPFPGGETLGMEIPESQIRYLGVETDLVAFISGSEEDDSPPPPIIRISFPESYDGALVPADLVPKRLMEAALLKVRNYLRNHGNKEYALHKLTPQLAGKESYLKDILNQITIRPLECYTAIVEGGEFSSLFWAHFCILVKDDIRKKKDHLSEDIAAGQSVYIIEAVNGYYKTLAIKRREREFAFKDLELHLGKPPYAYTVDQIIKFTNAKGVLLLGQYTQVELEEWLRKQSSESKDNGLPGLLVFSGQYNESCFVLKNKTLLLCARLLGEGREKVKTAVSKHWMHLISDYRSEDAMENDKDFDKRLANFTAKLCPVLSSLLNDPKLPLVYEEADRAHETIPAAARIFERGVLLPFSFLFALKRKELVEDARIMLPFWYSIPFISTVIAIFKNLTRRRRTAKEAADEEEEQGDDKGPSNELRRNAKELELFLVPPGYTLDSYLAELETRWSRLIDKQARTNLVEDVNSLVRDNLRQTLRVRRHYKVTRENLTTLAENIVNRTSSLQALHGKDSLRTYIELYLIKLLETIKL
jgi:hypothetical protein